MFAVWFGRLYESSLLGSKAFWYLFHEMNGNNLSSCVPVCMKVSLKCFVNRHKRQRILPLSYEYVKMQHKFQDVDNLALLLVFFFFLWTFFL